jgi:hypothetical protein
MAHFAKVNSDNIVEQVCVVNNTEAVSGQAFLHSLGLSGIWVQTSYNTRGNIHMLSGTPLRGNYAGIGYIYDSVNDVFYPSQPYPSWTISLSTNWLWSPPVPYPTDGKMYSWDETNTNWVLLSSI